MKLPRLTAALKIKNREVVVAIVAATARYIWVATSTDFKPQLITRRPA